MTSRIKNISELPKWFQLDKYKAAKKLDAAGWYEQFAIREPNNAMVNSRSRISASRDLKQHSSKH